MKNTLDLRVQDGLTDTELRAAPIPAALEDTTGRSGVMGVFGEQWATDVKNDIITNFTYGISNRDIKTPVTVGSGTVTIQEGNLLTASTGTDANGEVSVQSYNAIRHRNGHTTLSHFSALWTNPTALDCHQWIGLADDTDGYGIGFYNGNFTITIMRGGVHTHITSGFNGLLDPATIDFTKLQMFRISIDTLVATFEMLKPGTNKFESLHSVQMQNIATATNTQTSYLPIQVHVQNTGNTTDCQIRTNSWQGGIMGLCQECGNRGFSYPFTPGSVATTTGVSNTPTLLAAFRNVGTFQGQINRIRAVLEKFEFLPYNPIANTIVYVQLVAGATITGGTYTDIDSVNSVIQVNTTATGFSGGVAGLTLFTYITTGQGVTSPTATTANLDAEALQLFLDPGQEYAIVAFTSALTTVTVTWSVNWTELF